MGDEAQGCGWDMRGIAYIVLRLLEQGEITRSKARELLQELHHTGAIASRFPLNRLNWYGAATTALPSDPGEERDR